MLVWIIEDEKPAAARLVNMILEIEPSVQITAVLHSVQSALAHFREKDPPQLLFMDIELTDGLSFQIFQDMPPPCPIIFTTAYDEYWQQALANYGMDYLLKPVKHEDLQRAFQKYRQFQHHFIGQLQQFLGQYNQPATENYRKRLLIKKGREYVPVPVEDIAYLFAEQKLVCLVSTEGKKYILDQSLNELENELDPEQFYRMNRKYLVHRNAITKVKSWGRGKLLVELHPDTGDELTVSQELAGKFKVWLGN